MERAIYGSPLFATRETLRGESSRLLNAYEILINRARFWVMGFCISLLFADDRDFSRFLPFSIFNVSKIFLRIYSWKLNITQCVESKDFAIEMKRLVRIEERERERIKGYIYFERVI